MSVIDLRAALGLSQADLAALLHVTQPAVAAWEADKRKPNSAAALLIDSFKQIFEGRTRRYGTFRGRPIELPDERWQPMVKPDRVVKLPNRLDWSPRVGDWDLRKRVQRAAMYAQVLDEGLPSDIRFWIDPDALSKLWPDVPVARHMREPVGQMLAVL